jgi:hypothetical protein
MFFIIVILIWLFSVIPIKCQNFEMLKNNDFNANDSFY